MLYELFEIIKNMRTMRTIEIMWFAGYWTMMFFVGTAQPNNIIDICFMFVYGFSYALMGIYTLDILAKIKHAFNIHFHEYLHSIKPILSFVTNLILFIPRLISQVFNNIEIVIKSIMQNKRKHVSQVEETIALVKKHINPRFDADACENALNEIYDLVVKDPTALGVGLDIRTKAGREAKQLQQENSDGLKSAIFNYATIASGGEGQSFSADKFNKVLFEKIKNSDISLAEWMKVKTV